MSNDFFEYHLTRLKEKYPSFKDLQDYHLFTVLNMKYFFFNEDNIPFDQDIVKETITDGANDGGIDAIFNDPTSENNDIIVVQSKFYENTKLTVNDVTGELFKISETLKKLNSNKIAEFNDSLVTAYRNATSQMEDSGELRIVFFTSYEPKDKRERNKLDDKARSYFENDLHINIEMYFRSDIIAQIELCDNQKLCVDYDKLVIDSPNNHLRYEDSIIVNISALSLQELHNRRRNGLLGMNLRYYVRQKSVDDGIKKTVSEDPENFWYKNNGILIICDDFEIEENIIKLRNFSIVNGGQTTNLIGSQDIENDFFLQCKIVKSKGDSQYDKDKFVLDIAKATNAQKPIKDSDLYSNTVEQLRLKERLAKEKVYYCTKKGEKVPKEYSQPYQNIKIEEIGKLSLAAVLQMPGSSRSNSKKMYKDDYYYSIFGKNAKETVIADLSKLSYYYQKFTKNEIKDKGYDEQTVLPVLKNGKTFQLACFTLICKLMNHSVDYDEIARNKNDTDKLKQILSSMDNCNKLLVNNIENEEQIIFDIFSIIGEEILGYCFENALESAKKDNKTLAASDYLKSDLNYYKDIIPRLWSRYNKDKKLQEAFSILCIKK